MKKTNTSKSHPFWDAFCAASIVGIWPRFCEPRLLFTNFVTLKIKELPEGLDGLRILQFSDLHFSSSTSDSYLEKIKRKAAAFAPDLIVFTGDFLCRSQIEPKDKERLEHFLCSFPKAKYGSFAVLGNHDYDEFVSMNSSGEYAIMKPDTSPIGQGLKKIFSRSVKPKAMQIDVHNVPLHQSLLGLLSKTPFRLLHNSCATVPINGTALNIVGLGEYTLGRFDPSSAFRLWDDRFPGIILAHNPDCVPYLASFPGAVILSGHTHGGQINLPLIVKKFLVMENPRYKQGIFHVNGKWLYVNRGVGSLMPFRFFAPPELLCLTLVPST